MIIFYKMHSHRKNKMGQKALKKGTPCISGKTNFFKLARQKLPGFTVQWKPIRFLQFSTLHEFALFPKLKLPRLCTAADSLDNIDLFASYLFCKTILLRKNFGGKSKVYLKLLGELWGKIRLKIYNSVLIVRFLWVGQKHFPVKRNCA